MDDDVVSQAEAARLLGISRGRVEQLIDAGTLPSVEVPLLVRAVRRADVEAFGQRRRRPGRPRKSPAGEPSARRANPT